MTGVNDPDVKLLALILLAVIVAATAWVFRDDIFAPPEAPVVVLPEPVTEEEPVRKEPIHPIASPEMSMSPEGELVPLPPLDDSDAYFLLALIDLFGPTVEPTLVNEALVDKFVATVDNLTRSHVAEKIRPVGRLPGTFVAEPTDNGNEFLLSSDNYARYAALVDIAARADPDAAVAMYRRFYPIFQESYERLGYPDGYFNDRVVEVIDHLLATPELNEPVRLMRPHVLYEFTNEEFEALSSGQKLLLRMGDENAATIKAVLRDMRLRIAQAPG